MTSNFPHISPKIKSIQKLDFSFFVAQSGMRKYRDRIAILFMVALYGEIPFYHPFSFYARYLFYPLSCGKWPSRANFPFFSISEKQVGLREKGMFVEDNSGD